MQSRDQWSLLCNVQLGYNLAMPNTLGYHWVKSCYGLWLPGDDRGSWSEAWDDQLGFVEPHMLHEGDPVRLRMSQERMKHPPVTLTSPMIRIVAETLAACARESNGGLSFAALVNALRHRKTLVHQIRVFRTMPQMKQLGDDSVQKVAGIPARRPFTMLLHFARTRRVIFGIAIIAICTFASSLALASAPPPSDAEIDAKVDAIAASYLQRPGAVGLSIGVARKGEVIVAKGYGLADVELDVPANKDTMFRIGSVTKQFTAAAIMRFVEQGKISLDDELSKFIPDFPLQGNTVTIRQLLTHTSGIPSYTDLGEEWYKLIPNELTHDELLALVKDKPFDFKPGEQHKYNNTGYYMLGMIIEKIGGKPYDQHMHDEFFTPLGLERTCYGFNEPIIKNRAKGYGFENGKIVNAPHLGMSQPFAAGSLLSTGKDLVKWSMKLAGGKVVSAESFQSMTTPTILPNGEDTHYGFGLEVGKWEDRPCIRHGGGIHGFNSFLMYLPNEDVHVAVISNGMAVNSGRIANEIAHAAVGIEEFVAKDDPIPADLLKRIAGNFKMGPMDVTIVEEGGKAVVQPAGQPSFPLLWQGAEINDGREFRASFDDAVKMVYSDDFQSFTLYQNGSQIQANRVSH